MKTVATLVLLLLLFCGISVHGFQWLQGNIFWSALSVEAHFSLPVQDHIFVPLVFEIRAVENFLLQTVIGTLSVGLLVVGSARIVV